MKTYLYKYFCVSFIMITTLSLQSCSDKESYDVTGNSANKIYVNTGKGSATNAPKSLYSFKVVQTETGAVGDVHLQYPVRSTRPMSSSVTVKSEVDNSLIAAFNEKYKTTYVAFPDGVFDMSKALANIAQGDYISKDSIEVSIDPSKLSLLTEKAYLAPIRLTSVSSKGAEVSSDYTNTTVYLVVNITSTAGFFTALNMNNPDLYSNYIAPDNLAVNLANYTYEIKCYINAWHNTPEKISRLCSFTSKTESNSNMLRFGEGTDINSLQWVGPGGNLFSNTRFDTGKWYTISLTYDGSKFVMYVNGDKDVESSGTANCTFQRFELGMSWENYPAKQYFNGRVAEVRVWNRALTTSELKLGLCSVDPKSNGLVAYWKLNDGQGHIFKDATGHGYDMDWSKTWRDNTGGGTLNPFDKSTAVNWVADDKNKCEE